MTGAAGVLALLWMIVGLVRAFSTLPEGHQLGLGIYITLGGVLFIAAITVVEVIISYRDIERAVAPDTEVAVASPAT